MMSSATFAHNICKQQASLRWYDVQCDVCSQYLQSVGQLTGQLADKSFPSDLFSEDRLPEALYPTAAAASAATWTTQ
jgi:hypothetical protein